MMLTYTMLRRLTGALLQQCRVNDVQRKRRSRLTIGLGTAVIIFILLCTVACGGGDGALAKGGINMVVVSGQARIQSGGGNTLVVKDQEAVITAGDQVMADEAGVKLLLADGSLLYLNPDTDLRVVTFSAEGTARLSQLKGKLEVETASPLLTVEISTFVSDAFAQKTIQFTTTPAIRDTTFQLWIDDDNNVHLKVEAGEVNVTSNDGTETISTGGEVKAVPGVGLIVSPTAAPVEPTAVAEATTDLVPTITPALIHPSPTAAATLTVAPQEHPPPGLVGPADGDDFKPNDEILLMWDTTTLAEDEWYEVQLWREGDVPYTVVDRVKEGTWKVEPRYYPGRYQWRILVVRGREDQKETNLSSPSETWGFGWLQPVVQKPSPAPTSPPNGSKSVDLTVYLRSTNNAQGVATFSGAQVNAGTIYSEGGTVYGDVAVQIGDTVYHFNKDPEPGEPEQLPTPYRLEFKFSDSLLAATEGIQPGFNPQKAQFWVGTLDCNSAAPDKLYKIEMALYAGEETRKRTEVNFLVADAPLCGFTGEEPEEGGKEDIVRP